LFFIAEDAYNEHIYEEIPETRQQRLRPLPPIPEGTSLRQGCSTGAQTTTNFNMKQTISGKYADKNENEIFLIYEEIQMGSVAKSYIRKGFQINEEMRKYLTIYEEAVGPYIHI
jgi:hypothetical protein